VPYAAQAETLAEHGVHADVVPIGSGARHCVDLGLERDIDVLFLGALEVPRRRRVVRRLRRAGLEVRAVGGWEKPEFWGDERAKLLNRTRILLNIGRFPGQMSGHRLVLGMGAGALVLSEPIHRPEPFVPGRHYVSATLEEIPAVAKRLLGDDEAREEIARCGRDLVCTELTMESSLSRLAESLARDTPARADLRRHPVP
jgi:hypothetical protein